MGSHRGSTVWGGMQHRVATAVATQLATSTPTPCLLLYGWHLSECLSIFSPTMPLCHCPPYPRTAERGRGGRRLQTLKVKSVASLVLFAAWVYSEPSLSVENLFQDPLWIPNLQIIKFGVVVQHLYNLPRDCTLPSRTYMWPPGLSEGLLDATGSHF